MIQAVKTRVKTVFMANILIFGNDVNDLRFLKESLSIKGYKIHAIQDEKMVLAAITAKQPDLILLDIMMPSFSADEICFHLKNNAITRPIPVIFLSNLHESKHKVKAFSIGGADYITKPFQIAELIVRIENQLHIRRLEKQLQAQNERLKQELRERQILEQQLALREARLNAFFNGAPVGMSIIDRELRFVKINQYLAEINGIPAADHIGKSIREILPELAHIVEPLYQQVLATGKPILNLEISREIPNQPDVIGYWIVSYFPIPIAGNTLSGVGSVVVDITSIKQAEAALQKDILAADTANCAKSKFLASMSHELRTPLNAILGFSQIMSKDDSLSAEHKKNFSIINRAGEHLLALINDILEISKIEAGCTNFNETTFNMRQMLDGLEEMLELKAYSKGLQLNFEYSPDIPQFVKTDEGKLRQVLLNLLGNAIKFTQVGKVTLRVSISCPTSKVTTIDQEQKQTLHFQIEDTGPGINPEEIYLLFEAFRQTETGRKHQEGTGLGLPISQKYVQLMGGEITVSSTPGLGSIFVFDIQISLGDINPVQINKSYCQNIYLADDQPEYRILIVDDLPENRLLLIKILTPIGFSVREAENGEEAVKCWREWQPHLILMDIKMPLMDGYEATRKIRLEEQQRLYFAESSPDFLCLSAKTIIFALTASVFEEERKVILSAGCDDFISKPFQLEGLLQKIIQFLEAEYESKKEAKKSEFTHKNVDKLRLKDLRNQLAQMPPEWVQNIYNAASECSDDIIFKLLEEISTNNKDLINAIRDLAENFEFDKIIGLVQDVAYHDILPQSQDLN